MDFTVEQQEFLDSDGNVVLHACPGSGKTVVVAQKVINYIKNSSLFHQGVAVLSFTNVASKEIEKCISELTCGELIVDYPHYIGTLDSFINNFIVLRFGYKLWEQPIRLKIVIEAEYLRDSWKKWRKKCYTCDVHRNLAGLWLGQDDKFYYKNEIAKCKYVKWHNFPCFDFQRHMKKNGLLFQNQASRFAYELLKQEPEIAEVVAARFPFIIVDEAQDTSKDQMAVLDLLRQAGVRSMSLVGDPDQAIYEWRYASPEYFVEKMASKDWKRLRLSKNFRSSQLICNATQKFSNSLKSCMPSSAEGPCSGCKQKPILLLYDSANEVDVIKGKSIKEKEFIKEQLIEEFLKLCVMNGIKPDPKKVAVVTRRSVSVTVSKLWQTKIIELFAKAAFKWKEGLTKDAYDLCEEALYIFLVGDFEKVEISIEHEIGKIMSYDTWRLRVIDMLTRLPDTDKSLDDWDKEMKEALNNFLAASNSGVDQLKKKIRYSIDGAVKIKKKGNNIKNIRNLSVNDFFGKKSILEYNLSSIHGVKGETYSALMLFVDSKSGSTLTPSFLCKGELDKELMRLAYVAMTRPKKLLVVAVPNDKKITVCERFSTKLWEHRKVVIK